MAAPAIVTRQERAAGIVERHEAIPCDDGSGWYLVTDTVTGSGTQYLTSSTACSCPDHSFRGHYCKHIRAVNAESLTLTAYAISWDTMVEAARQTVRPCCPACGVELATVDYYVGGRGYVAFTVCPDDGSHYSRRA